MGNSSDKTWKTAQLNCGFGVSKVRGGHFFKLGDFAGGQKGTKTPEHLVRGF
jgi:hypothetical protein